jgi:hypothetical protein
MGVNAWKCVWVLLLLLLLLLQGNWLCPRHNDTFSSAVYSSHTP